MVSGDKGNWFYHGTNLENLPLITKEGLVPEKAVKQCWEEDETRSQEEYYLYSKKPFTIPPQEIEVLTDDGNWIPILDLNYS